MTPPPKPAPARTARGTAAAADREVRLAAALRANLGRRKAQSRRRDEAEPKGDKGA